MSFSDADFSSPVPLFPLPNVVLLPRAILPLHIFEQRYKQMMSDALRGERQIAMALLKPGWEKTYHGRPAIEPVVCLGRILQHEQLSDGCYNLLLQGVARAEVEQEFFDLIYRRADVKPVAQTSVLEIDLADHRRRLKQLFESGRVKLTDYSRHLMRLFDSPVPTSDLVDVLAFSLVGDVRAKQALLADGDVVRRVERTVDLLLRLHPEIPRDAQGRPAGGMN